MSSFTAKPITKIKELVQEIIKCWNNFFFGPVDLYNVGLFRLIFGISIFFLYLLRFKGFDVFFLGDGLVPYEWAQKALPLEYRTPFPFFVADDFWMWVQGYAHLAFVALFALGIIGRGFTWVLFLLQLGLMQRNMTVAYGADLFTLFWLFYLSFVRHNIRFSILNWIWPSRKVEGPMDDPLSRFGIRLLQIQLCLSYAYTGIEKLKGVQWWEGSAVWYVIGIDELIPHDFAFLKDFPVVVALLTQLTVIFEIYFVFAVWSRLRPVWLLIGFLFHLGTAVFMGLYFFCLVMIGPYLLFIESSTLKRAVERIAHGWRRLPLTLKLRG